MALHTVPFDPRRPDLLRPLAVDPTGRSGPTRGEARGPGYRRTSHGLYVPRTADATIVEQRIVEALPASEEAVVTGWAALRWVGGVWFAGVDVSGALLPVPVATVKSVRRRPGVWITKESWLDPAHLCRVDGLPVTSGVRSVHFAMRHAPSLMAAVIALDMAAYDDLVTVADVAAFTAVAGPRTGVAQARHALSLADENSWSPMETWMRLVWTIDAGLPRPLCNAPLFDLDGRHIGTPDLLEPVAGVVGEYDGATHLQREARRRDRDREEVFRSLGLEYVAVLAGDGRSETTVRRMRAAWERGRRRADEDRRWTVVAPPGWTSTATVEERRALALSGRGHLLAYRHAG